MANYATLKAAIQNVVKTNGNNEITGALLQQTLLTMVSSLGAGYQYMGIATPSTNPGTPDPNVFYFASTAGTYANFGSLVLADGEIAILKYNGTWSKDSTGAASLEKVNQLDQEVNGLNMTASGEKTGSGWLSVELPNELEAGKKYTLVFTKNVNMSGVAVSTSTSSSSANRVDIDIITLNYFAQNTTTLSDFIPSGNAKFLLFWCAGNVQIDVNVTGDGLTDIVEKNKTDISTNTTDISNNAKLIADIINVLGKGATQDLETTFENGRVDGSGNVVRETGSYHSIPIQVKKGDVVIFAAWCNAATSPISLTDASGSFYTPVIGTGSGYKKYQYIALNDGYVAFSYSVSSVYPDVVAQKATLSSLLSLINTLNQLTERVDILDGLKDYQTMFPSYVFGIESGTFNGREYATAIYPEAITKARIFPEQSQGEDTDRSQTYIRINNGKRLLLQKPKQDSYAYNHFDTPVEVIAQDAFVSGAGLMKKTFSFNYIRANRQNGQNKNIFVLLIGASITQQGGYPGYLQMLADMDNTDIGNLNIKVLGSNVGTVTPSITYEYNGQTKTIVTHTEGRAGWPTLALANWPFEARLDGATDTLGAMGMWYAAGMATKTPYDSTTPGQAFEPWSGTNTQKCALFGAVFGRYKPDYCADLWNALHNFHTRYRSGAHTIWYYSTGAEYTTGATIPAYNGSASDTIMARFFDDLCYNPDNVFYDRDRARAYTGSYIWTNKTAFSIAKWVERYRTLDDNGNQLTLGNGTGTFVTSSNINNPVCTPTIIFNGMGANDLVGMGYGAWSVIDGTYNTVKESILDFLNDIHAQMPTVPLGWGVPRQSGVFFPEDWDEIGIIPQITYWTIHRDWLNDLMMPEFEALSQNNDCNYIPIYYTSSPVSGQSPHYVGDFDRRKLENADLVVTGADLGHVGKEWECSVAYQILAWMYWTFQ